ncbi:glycosyltransferase family 39 protein, partial [Candidatus Fermentibacterales bacterium]|nr:glycosyltransferase family 39 protein [Candidatus Fermentibacterales bacterium]
MVATGSRGRAPTGRTLLLILAAVILPRLAWFCLLGGHLPLPVRDQALYLHLADRITSGHGLSYGADLALLKSRMGGETLLGSYWHGDPGYLFGLAPVETPTATVEPGYPALLAAGYLVFGPRAGTVFLINTGAMALGAIAVFLFVSRRWGSRAALGASLVWALYPYYVYYSAYAMSEALHVSLLPVCILLADMASGSGRSFWAGLSGLSCGLLFLVRSSAFPLPVLLAIYVGV